jgi:hypothetical protein
MDPTITTPLSPSPEKMTYVAGHRQPAESGLQPDNSEGTVPTENRMGGTGSTHPRDETFTQNFSWKNLMERDTQET